MAGAAKSEARSQLPCSPSRPCTAQSLQYIAIPPRNWNGRDRLRVALWLHGYGRTAHIPARNKKLVQVFDKHNFLFIAPSGYNKAWAVPGAPPTGRDDISYIADVLNDVGNHYPISRDDSVVLGFSLGASFVWTLACQRPDLFRYHIAIAGGFWRPHPKECATGPLNLLHIHGEKDGVVPLHGRKIGSRWYQGDVPQGLAFWRFTKGCEDFGQPYAGSGGSTCRNAQNCKSKQDTSIISCRHSGGHIVKPSWVNWALGQIAKAVK
ncbi:MAG: alpha/beta hydrolase family esterase [Hyphomicrobiaceae bacterium]